MQGNMKQWIQEAAVQKQCPWYDMYQRFGPANVKWCEHRLCAIIQEPANTWSNLAYIFPALVIFWWGLKIKNKQTQFYGVTLFIVGAFSLFYHMTNNYFTQYLDFFGMFMLMSMLMMYNFKRLSWLPSWGDIKVFLLWFIPLNGVFALFTVLEINIQAIVALLVLCVVGTEFLCRRNPKVVDNPSLKYFFISLFFMSVAISFSIADAKRAFCDPHNHVVQGHALWHFFAGIGLSFAYLYFRQMSWFEGKKAS